jgi:hypothetical protein
MKKAFPLTLSSSPAFSASRLALALVALLARRAVHLIHARRRNLDSSSGSVIPIAHQAQTLPRFTLLALAPALAERVAPLVPVLAGVVSPA